MALSEFYQGLRQQVGGSLLLIPAAAAIIRDDQGRILLQQQQHDDSWTLPGGAMDPGESPAQAVVREVFEETGLMVRPERIVAVVGGAGCRVHYANGDEAEYVVTLFECCVTGGEHIESNDETKQLAYFAADELPEFVVKYPPEIFAHPRHAFFAQP